MPPRDAAAETANPAQEVILQTSPEKGLELIEKAIESKGTTGVIEIAKQEADEAISGIHKLGTFDAAENYPGSAEEVMKMKSANEGAAKQVQEAVHALELDLSEFGEASKPTVIPSEVEGTSEISRLRSAPLEKTEGPPASIESKSLEQQSDEMMEETEPEEKFDFDKERALVDAASKKIAERIANLEAKSKPLGERDQTYLDYLQASQVNKQLYLDTLSADETLRKVKRLGDPVEEIRAEADFNQKREALIRQKEDFKAKEILAEPFDGDYVKDELQEALAETHEMIGKQSGLKVEGEKLVEKSDSEKLDDQIEAEEERLKAYEQEALQEKKTLDEFTGGHNIGMTDLEKGYANSLTAHIAHLEASAVLTELLVQKLRMQKGNNSEGVKRIEAEIALAEAEVERTHDEAERITKEYETMLQGIMNQPVDETAEPAAKAQEAAKPTNSISPSNFPLPKESGFAYAPATKKEPGAVSKIWGKVWKSMKFWEV